MNRDLYVLKAGELWLKGGNRPFFERQLRRHIKQQLSGFNPVLTMQYGRFFLYADGSQPEEVQSRLAKTFGLVGFSKACSTKKDIRSIREAALKICREACSSREISTFKIDSRRIDKGFPMDSYQISCDLGNAVSEAFPSLSVKLQKPDLKISVEVRDKVYIYGDTQSSPGGLPPGSAGKGILMLSGGIDSPIAGYLMAKRGLRIESVYFHSYPFTSEDALEKVRTLARIIGEYTGGMRLWVVPFTDVQVHINQHAPENERTLHMRAAMVQICGSLIRPVRAQCLITGESLSQVASQTVESLAFTNNMSKLPVFRPLIGMDKQEIISLARTIGTYDTSILPYDDCCTLFTPAHPLIKPELQAITDSYDSLQLGPLVKEAAENSVREQW